LLQYFLSHQNAYQDNSYCNSAGVSKGSDSIISIRCRLLVQFVVQHVVQQIHNKSKLMESEPKRVSRQFGGSVTNTACTSAITSTLQRVNNAFVLLLLSFNALFMCMF